MILPSCSCGLHKLCRGVSWHLPTDSMVFCSCTCGCTDIWKKDPS